MPGTPIKISDIIDPSLKTSAKDLSDMLRGVGNNVDNLKDSFEQLAKALKNNSGPMTTTAQGLADLEKRISALENAMNAVEAAQKANTAAMNAVNTTMTNLGQNAQNVVNALSNLGNTSNNTANSLGKMQSMTTAEAQAIQHLSGLISTYSGNLNQLNRIGAIAINVANNQNASYAYLKSLLSLLKGAMDSLTESQRNTMTGSNTLAQAIRKVEEALKTEKQTTEEANRAKREYKKLTDAEYQSVTQLKQAIEAGGKTRMDAVSNIQVETKSYNELQQTYNAIKDALNALTMAERDNSAEGVILTAKAKEIADAMNLAQQATGQYALNVGNYKSAFDGLGFSVQQVMREIPSTLATGRIDQFFLAISNNIPLVVDQINLFNRRAKEAAVKAAEVNAVIQKYETMLATMNSTDPGYTQLLDKVDQLKKSYADLQKQTTSWGRAVWLSIRSWQSGILLVLTLLPVLTKLIKNGIKNLKESRKEISFVSNEMSLLTAKAQVFSEVIKKTNDEVVQLDMVVERLKHIEKGSQEWKDAVAMVNDITKQNLDYVTTTKEEIEKVTEAYKEQAIQIATNEIIAEKIAKSRAQKALIKAAMEADTLEAALELAGIKADSKKGKEFAKKWNEYNVSRPRDYVPPEDWMKLPEMQSDLQVSPSPVKITMPSGDDKKRIAVENLVREEMQDLIDDSAEDALQQMIKEVKPLKKPKTGGNGSKSLKAFDDLSSYLLDKDAVIELESSFKKQLMMLEEEEKKERLLLENKYKKELADLQFNRENKLITETEYQEQLQEIQTNYNKITRENYEGNFEEMGVIQRKYWNKRNELTEKEAARQQKIAEKNDKQFIEDTKETYDNQLVVIKKHARTLTDEMSRNSGIISNMATLNEEINKFNSYTYESVDGCEKAQEEIDKLTKKIEELRSKLDFSKQLSGYKDISDLLKQNVDFGGDFKKGILTSMLGSDFVGAMTGDQIDSNFEMWLDSAYDSLKTWYDNTMGYIGDIIDAYYDLAQAKADAAAEETESARNEYEAQQALLEAGYANNMEIAKQEYLEKKKLQEQADKEAKKAQQMQLSLDTAQQASSMATAIANLYKMYSALPGGVALATVLTAAMLGTFVAAKIKAHQVAQYGEGTAELIEGGSHASGNDVSLAYDKKGRERRVEGGEVFGVIRKKSVRRYGKDTVLGIINSLNDGTYERDSVRMVERNKEIAIGAQSWRRSVDLSKIERSLTSIDRNGKGSSYVDSEGNYVEVRSNGKITHIKR